MLPPLLFHPLPQQRVWGGRRLAQLYGRELPSGEPIGESWEISDRPGAVSVIANGPLAGHDLRWLMENQATDLLGDVPSADGRFPWLFKILDAAETLSLQVHPPPGFPEGEPKTEAWYVADATNDAHLFAGLRSGITRAQFREQLESGQLETCIPRVPLSAGDAMFLPSGRLHALGGGTLVFEIQQNSDTTYRVFDWNRTGLDGRPRELHVDQAMAAIDFNDTEPPLAPAEGNPRTIADAPGLFKVEQHILSACSTLELSTGLQVVAVVTGALEMGNLTLAPGDHCLLPACLGPVRLRANSDTTLLLTCQ